MRGLDDRQPSDLILDEPKLREAGLYGPVGPGSWTDALKRQVASLQAAGNEYREEIHRLRGLLGEAKADLRAERGGPVGGIEVRMMGPRPGRDILQLQLCISDTILLQGGREAIAHLCATAAKHLDRERERRVANP